MSRLPPARQHHHPRQWRHLLVPGGCILGLSALSLLFWVIVPSLPSSGISANRAALASALGAARPLEGRITGGFGYLPLKMQIQIFDGFVGGYQRPPRLETSQTRRAIPFARQIESEYQKNPTPQALGDKALLILVGEANHETALPLLQEAVQRDPRNATLWSDLAAMYLASTRPTPPGRFLALEAAHRAITEDPSLLEARFNFALALERCSLFRQAARAWEEYIRLDPSSGWSEEARNHLKGLHRPRPYELWHSVWKKRVKTGISLASLPYGMARVGIHQIAREDAMEKILGRWGSLTSKGRSVEAAREFDSARKIGNIIPNDRTVSDTVKVIETATEETRNSLAQAHRSYLVGIQAFQAGRMDLAEPELEVSSNLFSRSDSPFEHWANLALAEIACYRSDFLTMESLFAKIRSRANLTRYPALNQRLFWIEGFSYLSRLELTLAQSSFRSAGWMGFDEEQFGGVANLYISKSSEETSSPEWLSIYRALRTLPNFPESKHLTELFRSLADIFSEDHPTVAAILLNEALEATNALKDPSSAIEILIDRSMLLDQIGDKDAAQRDLAAIERKWTTLRGNIFQHRLEIKKGVARCQILDYLLPAQCIIALTEAIAYYQEHDQRLLAEIYKIRADVHHRLSDIEAEESDLMKAIRFYERGIASFGTSQSLRFDQTKGLYEKIADLELSRGNYVRAFELIDHSRTIFPVLASKGHRDYAFHDIPFSTGCNLRPYSWKELLHKLPKWITLIEYVVRGEEVEAWVFRDRSARLIKLEVTRKQILRHLPPILDPPRGQLRMVHIDAATPELSQWLLQPIISWLPEDGDIFFLAGPLFEQVDFAALKHPQTQQSLCSSKRAVGSMFKDESFSLNGDLPKALKLLRGSPKGRLADVNDKPQRERPYITMNSILNKLPENSALIEYSILKDRLSIWAVSQGHSSFHSASINSIKIDDLVDRWLATLSNPESDQNHRISTFLHQLLIAPIMDHLPRPSNVVIIPDKSLTKLPFAALLDPKSGKYLIEDFSISTTTSATLYLQQLERYPNSDHKNWTVYAINNPISDEKHAPRKSLPGAVSEAENIVQLFPGSEMVAGRDANYRRSFRTRSHPIVHFAGHWNPLIKFYDGTIEADSLHVDENVKLVVLSACRTFSSRYWLRSSIFGIAGNFLDRWVPAVVASHWEVEDRATNQLLHRFYIHLRAGQDAANALRSAQLELLHGEDRALRHPSKWASFQLLGFGGI